MKKEWENECNYLIKIFHNTKYNVYCIEQDIIMQHEIHECMLCYKLCIDLQEYLTCYIYTLIDPHFSF